MRITEAMIAEILRQKNYKLLSQIEVSDEQYQDVLSYLRKWLKSPQPQTIVPSNLMVSLGLVQVAIRHYQEGRFWPCFVAQLGVSIPSSKTNYLGQVFYKTIQHYGLFCPHREGSDFQYVEYIKAHAFVTNSYMHGFFDFSYAYFENNLFRQLAEDISEDVEALSQFMGTTLNSKTDTIVSGKESGKAAKTYRLLKSTRTTFAQCDLAIVTELFYPVLEMLDAFFYDNKVPEMPTDRFQKGFLQWCAAQAEKESTKSNGTKNKRQALHHKPYIKVLVDKEQAVLVIPSQKFRQEEWSGNAVAEVISNQYTKAVPLEVYQSFGLYISEEREVMIPGAFDAIDVTIRTLSEKSYRIPASNYRIFNNSWESIARFNKGHNYILVKPGIETAWEHEEDLIDYTDVYRNWQYFSANINTDSVFYVGNKPLSIIGEFSSEPIFEQPIEYFSVYCDSDKKMSATQSHPSVSFVIEKNKANGTVVLVNDYKYALEEIQEKVCYDWPGDKNKLAITVMLDHFLNWVDGYYSVKLDIPGDGIKTLCEYVLLRQFKCRFNKPRYTYTPEAELHIKHGDYTVQVLDSAWRILQQSATDMVCGIPLETLSETVDFLLTIDREYRISVPLRVFAYGFSMQELRTQKEDYIWYADLKENLYVKIPGAQTAGAYLGKDRTTLVCGTMISPGLFRIDISEFINTIKVGENRQYYYLNIEYTDNIPRHLKLPVICRQPVVDPYFRIYATNGKPYLDLYISGKAQVYLTARECGGDTVLERKLIQSGITYLPELEMDKLYDLCPVMEESDEFGLSTVESALRPLTKVGAIDFDNLINCRMPILALVVDNDTKPLDYDYFLVLNEKEDSSTYIGYLYGLKIAPSQGKREYATDYLGRKIKTSLEKVRAIVQITENEITVALQCYSEVDEDWMLPYYDKKTREVIHCDDKRLEAHGNQDRFTMLEDNLCCYTVDASKLKRIR